MGPHPIVLLRLGLDNYLQKIFSTISIISVLTSCCSAEISLILTVGLVFEEGNCEAFHEFRYKLWYFVEQYALIRD